MSQSKGVSKPFLKKGSRQYLSNAQVRSQPSKSKIVDYSQQESPTLQNYPKQVQKKAKVQHPPIPKRQEKGVYEQPQKRQPPLPSKTSSGKKYFAQQQEETDKYQNYITFKAKPAQESRKSVRSTSISKAQPKQSSKQYQHDAYRQPQRESFKTHTKQQIKPKEQVFLDQNQSWDQPDPQDKPLGQSNIIKKYFNKGNKKNEIVTVAAPMTVESIPLALKQQIIKQYVGQKIQQLNAQIQKTKLQKQRLALLKSKQQQLNRQFTKEKQQFEKAMQVQKKAFQQMKKEELKKYQKDRKIVTDKLSNNLPNRKERQQIQSLKKQVQSLQTEKKKLESKLVSTEQRLRKKIQEEQAKNRLLASEIKVLQIQRLKRDQDKEKDRVDKKRTISKQPKTTVLSSPKAASKSKLQLFPLQRLSLQHLQERELSVFKTIQNEYYLKYQQSEKGRQLKQRIENGKYIRQFQNGITQIQSPNHYTKQVNSTGYQICHFARGDIKQKLPSGVVVTFAQNQRLIETTFNENLRVYYFLDQDQIQVHKPDAVEIRNAQGIIRINRKNGDQQTHFPNRMVKIKKSSQNILQVHHPDGRCQQFPLSN